MKEGRPQKSGEDASRQWLGSRVCRWVLRPWSLVAGVLVLLLGFLVLLFGYRFIMVPRLEATIRSWEEDIAEFTTPRLAEPGEGPLAEMIHGRPAVKQHVDLEAHITNHGIYRWAVQFIPIEDRERVERRHEKLEYFHSLAEERVKAEILSRPWADHHTVEENQPQSTPRSE